MANADRGEIPVDIAGREYLLHLTMKAARQLQARNKKSIGELLLAAERLDYDAIAEMTFGLLQEHHGKDFPTIGDVDALIDRAGGPDFFFDYCEKHRIIQDITKASRMRGVGGADGNPPTAQAGTGGNSESPLVGSA